MEKIAWLENKSLDNAKEESKTKIKYYFCKRCKIRISINFRSFFQVDRFAIKWFSTCHFFFSFYGYNLTVVYSPDLLCMFTL